MHSQRWKFWRLGGAAFTALALSACGGGDTSADTQTVGARNETTGAAAHDATADHFFGSIQKFV
ncbi:MAG TPA: hypothetical protein VLJ62_06270, partial [Burkholderiaceae bacterium]|nr:hypothetical protein [Burkholderiaceae bacterium]